MLDATDLLAIAAYCWGCTALSAGVWAFWQWATRVVETATEEGLFMEVRTENEADEHYWEARAKALEEALETMGYRVVDVTTDDDGSQVALQVFPAGDPDA